MYIGIKIIHKDWILRRRNKLNIDEQVSSLNDLMRLETNIKLALQRAGNWCRILKLLLYATLTLFKLCFFKFTP